MKIIKLTAEQFQRSLKSKLDHLWVMDSTTSTKSVRNSIYSNSQGEPVACIVCDGAVSDSVVKRHFGPHAFIEGSVSPEDKENMRWDSYYISK
jgi:hypothetical protein